MWAKLLRWLGGRLLPRFSLGKQLVQVLSHDVCPARTTSQRLRGLHAQTEQHVRRRWRTCPGAAAVGMCGRLAVLPLTQPERQRSAGLCWLALIWTGPAPTPALHPPNCGAPWSTASNSCCAQIGRRAVLTNVQAYLATGCVAKGLGSFSCGGSDCCRGSWTGAALPASIPECRTSLASTRGVSGVWAGCEVMRWRETPSTRSARGEYRLGLLVDEQFQESPHHLQAQEVWSAWACCEFEQL